MKKGYLSNYFSAVVGKRLSRVEIAGLCSNQHEFNGISEFRQLFGDSKKLFEAKFLYVGEDDEDAIVDTGKLTWYDARENHPTRTEYRLYYPSLNFFDKVKEGDLLVICMMSSNQLLVVFAQGYSTIENQLIWLFGLDIDAINNKLSFKKIRDSNDKTLDFTARKILSQLEIEPELPPPPAKDIDLAIEKFGKKFPSTRQFSSFCRKICNVSKPEEDPDSVILCWMEKEECLFKALEDCILLDQIKKGFSSVDSFMSFSLSVQNRRKSRAGHAFENHLESLFQTFKLRYSRNEITEYNSKPDFIFPGITEYHDDNFPITNLFMLAVKTSCKDRWRQVLAEANRIKSKHLITLEAAISVKQTEQMKAKSLQLIIPKPIQNSYTTPQQEYLISLREFITIVS